MAQTLHSSGPHTPAPRHGKTAPAGASDVGALIARMRALGASWPAGDGVAVFHRTYLTVTEEAGRRLRFGACPDAPAALGVRLAERYLAAVDTVADGRRPAACWRPLFQQRRHPGVRPVQFALAGINAHIGHDLALAVVDACHTLGCRPVDLEDEFDRVGDLLTALEERIREDLTPGPDLLEVTDPLTHLVGVWSLERACSAAWSAARVLWGLRELPELAEEFRVRLDDGVGLVGRCLLTPWR
ncbi:DUF5995 family protein [Streptomyces sp. O3]